MHTNLPVFSGHRILVVGDVMLDRYWAGSTERVSPEAPVPIVHIGEGHERPGGAANVAANLSSIGVSSIIIGLIGKDLEGERLGELLQGLRIEDALIRCEDGATITKLRVLSRHQQLLRLDFEKKFEASASTKLAKRFQDTLEKVDAVIASDYGKGALTQLPELIHMAHAKGIPILVDPKGSDFSRYRNATVVTPNRAEFETIVGSCVDNATLIERGERLRHDLALNALLITRGEEGMTLISEDSGPMHLPAQAREVADVTGAGDTVIALIAAGLVSQLSMSDACALANLAAGIVVGKVGAASVTPAELKWAAHLRGRGAIDEDTLLSLVAAARDNHERVVMTNGCFDLIHAGHVQYLSEARALGDRLIVAVNDDASVSRLKGNGRPIMPLEERMAVLAALADVDWVVPFSEDTPARLIARVSPDILVKGGDYSVSEIAGAREVLEAGGDVRVLNFVSGKSTSSLIERIRDG